MPKKVKKPKVKSVSKLKKDLWKLVSEYVRRRASDFRGNADCVTCGRTYHWKQLQGGHFIPGRHNAILFDLRHIHPQCYACNVPMKGNPRKYDAYMRENYGEKVIKELENLDAIEKQFHAPELLSEIERYKLLLKTL